MILPLTAPEGQISITSVIKNNPNKQYVKEIQEYSSKLTMHITGLNLAKYLAKIDYFEKAELLELRQRYSPSNEDFFGRLHRPIDKIWMAKGGSANYYVSDASKNKLKEIVGDVKDGYPLRKWIETFWLKPAHYDPMGMVFMEVGNAATYPVYRSCHDVYDYPPPKGRKFDYIVFKTDDRITAEKTDPNKATDIYYRVVDDVKDYLIKWDGDRATIVTQSTFKNYFKEVPAITNGNVYDPICKHFISPDHDVIGLADQHLRDRSVLTMFKLHHGFPLKWMYGTDCPTCNGSKKVSSKPCPSCGGTGKKSKYDVSETIIVPFPKVGDPMPAEYAGFYSPPVESWTKMDETISEQYRSAHYTLWGTNQMEDSESAQPATATGRFIDVQPVNDRLNGYADAAEFVETWITDKIGKFNFKSYTGCEINYGRRFLIETPDEVAAKFQEAKAGNSPFLALRYLYMQWLQSEFQSDSVELGKQMKLFQLDYWPLLTLGEAKTTITNPDDILRKEYFALWVETLLPNDLIAKTLEALKKLRDKFIDDKITETNKVMQAKAEQDAKTQMIGKPIKKAA